MILKEFFDFNNYIYNILHGSPCNNEYEAIGFVFEVIDPDAERFANLEE